MRVTELFDLTKTAASPLLERFLYPYEALPYVGEFIRVLGECLDMRLYRKLSDDVWVAKSADVAPSAFINGPTIIGEGSSVRPHRRQPTRLLRPWDFPGKSTGVGCHCLLCCKAANEEKKNENFELK